MSIGNVIGLKGKTIEQHLGEVLEADYNEVITIGVNDCEEDCVIEVLSSARSTEELNISEVNYYMDLAKTAVLNS